MATAAKKVKRSCKVLDSWFSEPEFQGMFRHNHPNNTNTSLYCLLCEKSVDKKLSWKVSHCYDECEKGARFHYITL